MFLVTHYFPKLCCKMYQNSRRTGRGARWRSPHGLPKKIEKWAHHLGKIVKGMGDAWRYGVWVMRGDFIMQVLDLF